MYNTIQYCTIVHIHIAISIVLADHMTIQCTIHYNTKTYCAILSVLYYVVIYCTCLSPILPRVWFADDYCSLALLLITTIITAHCSSLLAIDPDYCTIATHFTTHYYSHYFIITAFITSHYFSSDGIITSYYYGCNGFITSYYYRSNGFITSHCYQSVMGSNGFITFYY